MKLLASLVLTFCLALSSTHAVAADLIQDLGRTADHFLDRSGKLTIEDVSSTTAHRFNKTTGRSANYGPRPNPEAVLWLRVAVPAMAKNAPDDWTLIHPELRIRRAELYISSGGDWRKSVWLPEDQQNPDASTTRYPVFYASTDTLAGNTIYLRIETASSMRGLLLLMPADQFTIQYSSQSTWFGVAIGLLGVLTIYLFATGLAARDKTSMLLAAFAASYLSYLVAHQAFFETVFWPGALTASRILSLGGTCMIFATRLFFLDAFLDVASHRPWLSRTIRGLGWFFVSLACLVGVDIWFNGQTVLRLYTSTLGVISLLFGLLVLAAMVPKDSRRVGLYLLCWGPMLFAGLTRLLHDAVPSLGVYVLTLNATYVMTCMCFLVSGIVTATEMHSRERQRRTEAEAGRQRLRDMALNTSDSFWETDPAGKLTFSVGPTGEAAGLVSGHNLSVQLHALDPIGASEVETALTGRVAFQQRLVLADAENGRRRILELRGRPFGDPETGLLGYRGVISDISREVERQSAEAQQHKLAAVGQLAGGVAHEINNLLHPIINLSRRTAMALPEADEKKRWLGAVVDSAGRAAEIVTGLLATVRPSAALAEPVALKEGIERAMESIQAVTPQGIKLSFSGDGSKGPTVLPHETFQIVLNLVSNAIHATQGSGVVKIGLNAADDSGRRDRVILSIEDNGIGMDEETCRRALEPFYSRKAGGDGTGLGLSIVHNIVQRFGGQIDISSRLGVGTRIDVYLPLKVKEPGSLVP